MRRVEIEEVSTHERNQRHVEKHKSERPTHSHRPILRADRVEVLSRNMIQFLSQRAGGIAL